MPCSAIRPSHSLRCSVVAADQDRVAAQEGGEHRGGDADVDPCHPLADPVRVERAAAQTAVLLGDEDQMDAEVVAAHRAHGLLGAGVVAVEVEPAARRQLRRRGSRPARTA